MSVFALYRFYDAAGDLLYVGQTINPGRRMEKHRGTNAWWGDVARIDMEQFPDRPALLAAERAAIKEDKPKHNVRMNGYGTRPDAPVPASELDGLVGRWFHSWEEPGPDPKYRTVVNGRAVVWQGQIVDRDEDDYFVQLYSWWDGSANGGEHLIARSEMRDWTFYRSPLEMQVALGCRETDGDWQCRNPATHMTGLGNVCCWKCARYYPGAKEIT